jgi:diguanylate cyclase (GGDEF)-like protein
VYAVCAAVNNYLVSKLGDKTTFIDLLADPAFLLLAAQVVRLPLSASVPRHAAAGDVAMTRLVDNASPVIYTVTLILLSAVSLQQHFALGIFGIALALTVYAIRTTFLQNRFIQSERLLKEANNRLVELSFKDALTRVANRRSFDQRTAEEWRRSPGEPMSLLLIDLDHFKGLNDLYGHRAGDECLALVASTLEAELGSEHDLLARFGGEEFAAVLPGTGSAGALRVAERMRLAVRGLAIENEASAHQVLTASIGVASAVRGAGGSLAELVEVTDRALYLAKERGRDRVEFLQVDISRIRRLVRAQNPQQSRNPATNAGVASATGHRKG